MKTEIVELSLIKTNSKNPRRINDDKFIKLVDSILVFPKMLELRPVVVDDKVDSLVSLGGNMRYLGLKFISKMSIEELKARLCDIRDFQKKTEAEKDALITYWEHWQNKPTAPIIKTSELSDEEKQQFIIKDNLSYGEWDMDILLKWDMSELEGWGMDLPFSGTKVDPNDFFKDEEKKDKEPRMVICPHCGKEHEL